MAPRIRIRDVDATFRNADYDRVPNFAESMLKGHVTFAALYRIAVQNKAYTYMREIMDQVLRMANPPAIRWGFSTLEDVFEALHNIGMDFDMNLQIIINLSQPIHKCGARVSELESVILELKANQSLSAAELKRLGADVTLKQREIDRIVKEIEQARRDRDEVIRDQQDMVARLKHLQSMIGAPEPAMQMRLKIAEAARDRAMQAAANANDEIARLNANITNMRAQLAAAQNNADGLRARLTAAQNNAANLRAQLAAAQRNVDAVYARLMAAQARINLADAARAHAEQEAADLREQLNEAQGEVKALNAALEQANQEIEALREQLNNADDIIDDLRLQLWHAMDEINAMLEQGGANRAQIEQMRNQLAEARAQRDQAMHDAQNCQEQLAKVQAELDAMRAQREIATQRAEDLHRRLTEAEHTIEILNNQINANQVAAEQNIDRVRAERDDAIREVENLRRQLNDAEAQIKAANQAREAAEHEAADLRAQLTDAQARLDEANAALDDLRRQLHEAHDEIDDLRMKLNYANQDADAMRAQIEQLQKQLAAAQAEIKAANEAREHAELEAAQLRKQLVEAEEEIKRLNNLINTNQGAAATDLADLRAKLRAAEKNVDELHARLIAAQVQIDQANAARARAEDEIERLRAQLEKATIQLNNERDEKNTALAKVKNLQAQLNEALALIKAANEARDHAIKEAERLRAEIKANQDAAAADFAALRAQLNEAEARIQAANKAREDAEKAAANLRAQLADLEVRFKKLQNKEIDEWYNLYNVNKKIQAEIDAALGRQKKAEADIEFLRKQLTKALADIEAEKNKRALSEEEADKLREQLKQSVNKNDFDDLNERLKKSMIQIKDADAAREGAEKEAADLRAKLDAAIKAREGAEKEAADLRANLNEAQAKVEELQKEKAAMVILLTKTDAEVAALRAQLKEAEARPTKETVDELRAQLDEAIKERDAAAKELLNIQRQLNEANAKIETDRIAAAENIKELNNKLAAAKKQQEASNEQIVQLQTEIQTLKDALEKARAQAVPKSEIERLQNELDKANAYLNKANEERDAAQTEIGIIKAQLNEQIAANQKATAALKKCEDTSTAEIQRLKAELSAAQARLQSRDDALKKIEAALAEKQAELDTLKAELKDIEYTKGEAATALKLKIDKYETDLQKLREELAAATQARDKMAAELKTCNDALIAEQQNVAGVKAELAAAKQARDEAATKLNACQAALEEAEKAHKHALADLNMCKADAEQAKSESAKTTETIVKAAEEARKKADEALKKCQDELEAAQTARANAAKELEIALEKMRAAQAQIIKLGIEQKECLEQIKVYEKNFNRIAAELLNAQKNYSNTLDQFHANQKLLDDCQKELTNAKGSDDEKNNKIKQLEAQIKDNMANLKSTEEEIQNKTKELAAEKESRDRAEKQLNAEKAALVAQIETLTQKITTITTERDEYRKLLQESIADRETSIKNTSDSMDKFKAEIEKANKDLGIMNIKKAELETKLDNLNKNAAENAAQVKNLEQTNATLIQERDAARAELAQLQKAEAGIKMYSTELMNDLNHLINGIINDINQANSKEADRLNKVKQDEPKERATKIEDIIKTLEDILKKLTNSYKNCLDELTRCKEERAALINEKEAAAKAAEAAAKATEEAAKKPTVVDCGTLTELANITKLLSEDDRFARDTKNVDGSNANQLIKASLNIDSHLKQCKDGKTEVPTKEVDNLNKLVQSNADNIDDYINNCLKLTEQELNDIKRIDPEFAKTLMTQFEILKAMPRNNYDTFVNLIKLLKANLNDQTNITKTKDYYKYLIDDFIKCLELIQNKYEDGIEKKKYKELLSTLKTEYKMDKLYESGRTFMDYIRAFSLVSARSDWHIINSICEDLRGSVRVYVKLNLPQEDINYFTVKNQPLPLIAESITNNNMHSVKFMRDSGCDTCDKCAEQAKKQAWTWINKCSCTSAAAHPTCSCGPFYEVIDSHTITNEGWVSTGNDVIINKMYGLLDLLKQGSGVVIFGTGYSGSGKTYTLYGKDGNPGVKGVVQRAIEYVAPDNRCKVYIDEVKDLYYEGVVLKQVKDKYKLLSVFKEPIKPISVNQINTVIKEITDIRIKHGLIKATPNNVESSRSHLCVTFRFECNNSNYGKFTVIDMGGSEDIEAILDSYKQDNSEYHLDEVLDYYSIIENDESTNDLVSLVKNNKLKSKQLITQCIRRALSYIKYEQRVTTVVIQSVAATKNVNSYITKYGYPYATDKIKVEEHESFKQNMNTLNKKNEALMIFLLGFVHFFITKYVVSLVREGEYINDSIAGLNIYFKLKIDKGGKPPGFNDINTVIKKLPPRSPAQSSPMLPLRGDLDMIDFVKAVDITTDNSKLNTKFVNIVLIKNIANLKNCRGASDAMNFAMQVAAITPVENAAAKL